MLRKSIATIAAALLVSSLKLSAGLVNGGFELGDFSNWAVTIGVATNFESVPAPSANGLPYYTNRIKEVVSVGWLKMDTAVTNYVYNPTRQTNVHYPIGGSYLAEVGVGVPFSGLDTRGDAPIAPKFDTSLSQTIQLNIGDRLNGWAYFYNGDYVAQDSAWVKIFDSANAEIANPWLQISGSMALYRTTTPWTFWEWTAPNDGSYTLALGGTTFGDCAFPSTAYFDGIQFTPAQVPEPSSAVFLLGVSSILCVTRKKFFRAC